MGVRSEHDSTSVVEANCCKKGGTYSEIKAMGARKYRLKSWASSHRPSWFFFPFADPPQFRKGCDSHSTYHIQIPDPPQGARPLILVQLTARAEANIHGTSPGYDPEVDCFSVTTCDKIFGNGYVQVSASIRGSFQTMPIPGFPIPYWTPTGKRKDFASLSKTKRFFETSQDIDVDVDSTTSVEVVRVTFGGYEASVYARHKIRIKGYWVLAGGAKKLLFDWEGTPDKEGYLKHSSEDKAHEKEKQKKNDDAVNGAGNDEVIEKLPSEGEGKSGEEIEFSESSGEGFSIPVDDPMIILKKRLAMGEISKDEFNELKSTLE